MRIPLPSKTDSEKLLNCQWQIIIYSQYQRYIYQSNEARGYCDIGYPSLLICHSCDVCHRISFWKYDFLVQGLRVAPLVRSYTYSCGQHTVTATLGLIPLKSVSSWCHNNLSHNTRSWRAKNVIEDNHIDRFSTDAHRLYIYTGMNHGAPQGIFRGAD